MNVIKKKTLDSFAARFTDAAEQSRGWRKVFEKNDFRDIESVREALPSADFADPYTIFNIKGNSYRLITVIHYRYKRVYIKDFMTHAEYDRCYKDRKRGNRK